MMKSIFMENEGGHIVRRVYPAHVTARLKEIAGLDDSVVVGKNDLCQQQELTRQADYIFATWGMPALTAEEIREYLPNLKAVFYAAGSVQGFARPFSENGVRVFSAWAANGVPVAEFTTSQILLANKGYFQACRLQSAGQLDQARRHAGQFPGSFGCSVGLIGVGMIGSMVARKLQDYRLHVMAYDPFLPAEKAQSLGIELCSLERLFSECQTISNHLANNPQTVGMLNYRLFSRMKNNAVFINTGRGAQVVEEDLVRALREQPDRTAVLDVTVPEPPQPGHPFYEMPNVFLTPHIAGSTGDEVHRMAEYMLACCESVLATGQAEYEVDLAMLETMA